MHGYSKVPVAQVYPILQIGGFAAANKSEVSIKVVAETLVTHGEQPG